jgi:hypothetical protein
VAKCTYKHHVVWQAFLVLDSPASSLQFCPDNSIFPSSSSSEAKRHHRASRPSSPTGVASDRRSETGSATALVVAVLVSCQGHEHESSRDEER